MFWDPVLQDSLVGNKLHSNTGCKENERRCESNSQRFQSLTPEQEVHGTSVYMGILPNGCFDERRKIQHKASYICYRLKNCGSASRAQPSKNPVTFIQEKVNAMVDKSFHSSFSFF